MTGKKILSALLLLLFLCGFTLASDLKTADGLFNKNLFEKALQEYETVYEESKDPETRFKAFFRICESLAHLWRYGEAAKKLLSTPLPEDIHNRIRFLILKAELLRNFSAQYSSIQRREIIDEKDAAEDVFKLTPQEIKSEIKKSYEKLWSLRNNLAAMNIQKEEYFLDVKKIDLGMYSVLFDYVVLRWTDFLINEASQRGEGFTRPPVSLVLKEHFERPINLDDPPLFLSMEIMEEASRFSKENRLEASERWKIQRLLLALRSDLFDIKELAKDKTIEDKKDRMALWSQVRAILLNWMEKFQTEEAQAEAGFEAASLFNNSEEYPDSVDLCEKIESSFPKTYAAVRAKSLRLSIQKPSLEFQAKLSRPPARDAFEVTTRNLKKIYFRLYPVDPYSLKDEFLQEHKFFYTWQQIFSWSDQDWIKKLTQSFLSSQPLHKWSFETGDKRDHRYIKQKISPPDLESGIYLTLACGDHNFHVGRSLMSACFLNVTDFVLVETGGATLNADKIYYQFLEKKHNAWLEDSLFRFYALDAETGKPVPDVNLDVHGDINTWNQRTNKNYSLKTEETGIAELILPLSVSPDGYNEYEIKTMAKKNQSFAFLRDRKYLSYSAPNPIRIFIETDRPIYRPGHSVQAKAVALRKAPHGFKTLDSTRKITFFASDPNGKEFFKKVMPLNEFGSASVSFDIPQGRLLGRYSLSAWCQDGRFSGSAQSVFSVEEYKRPEFEIELKKAEAPWKYNEPAEIKGSVKYYFGGPVPDAPVKYRIKRQRFIPWFYRSWFSRDYAAEGLEIASGELKTDSEGNFVISFTPTSPPKGYYWSQIPEISEFIIQVEARDSGGRTLSAQESYKAGQNALYFIMEPKKGFGMEEEAIEIESRLLTVNDSPSEGKSHYEVYRLKETPAKPIKENQYSYGSGFEKWIPPLDVQLKDVPNGKLVTMGKVIYDKKGEKTIRLSPLPQGTYRIIQKTQDPYENRVKQGKIFVVAKNKSTAVPVNAASVLLAEKDEYQPGETARFVLGSGLGKGIYYVELWIGETFYKNILFNTHLPVKLIEIPVTAEMKGGFTLRWFGVTDLELLYNQDSFSVPWTEKKLNITLKPFSKVLKPGEKATWGIQITDIKKRPVQGEALALMYDRSLEYYMKSRNPWLDSLYAPHPQPSEGSDSVFNPQTFYLSIKEGLLSQIVRFFSKPSEIPGPPGLRSWRTWGYGYSRGARYRMEHVGGTPPGALADASEVIQEEISVEAESPAIELEAGKITAPPGPPDVKTRKAFADTAFFIPHIKTSDKEAGTFSFTTPEQLTSWKIKALAFTKDARERTLLEEAVTRKDLMVRLDLPRFFREKDKGTVTAVVHNESDMHLQGKLWIEVTEKDKSIMDKIKLSKSNQTFSIKPHSIQTFNWMVEIPSGVSSYKFRATASSGKLSDAEERELPILPSRQRLIENAFVSLMGDQAKKLEIRLKDDPTRINESMILQIDPQLTLSILNTLPFLIEYPHECVEQTLNKLVPLAIVNEIYKKYPCIQKAVAKIPKRKTVTPPWEKDDPHRLTILMETPWVWQSEGRPTSWPVIDLLDPEIVSEHKNRQLEKLKAVQLPDGAFPWWPGGRPDTYMTLLVLAGFAEAKNYGVDIPKELVNNALEYVNRKIPEQLKPEEYNLCLISYAAYVVTSFPPEEFPPAKTGFSAAQSWVAYLDKHIHALTPFGKAYLACTYRRLGKSTRSSEILDMAIDGAREDPVAGVYWTPEKYSWIWYSDTVEKHAFFLRTLMTLRPDSELIPGMVQWLLFNRKGNVWKSTKASSAAIYSLLDFLNRRGALASDESFKIKWANTTDSVVVHSDEWHPDPFRWTVEGFSITPSHASASIEKSGPGFTFASLSWIYSTDQIPEPSSPSLLSLGRTFYLRYKKDNSYHLKPLSSSEAVPVGAQIEVHLKINTKSHFEYMHLKDLKAAGFEAETLLSGWKWDPLRFYEEPRDSLTNFFISWLPHGEYILRYRLRPTKPGTYRIGAATLQSMYSPEMTAHSSGFILNVIEDEKK